MFNQWRSFMKHDAKKKKHHPKDEAMKEPIAKGIKEENHHKKHEHKKK